MRTPYTPAMARRLSETRLQALADMLTRTADDAEGLWNLQAELAERRRQLAFVADFLTSERRRGGYPAEV